MWSMLRTLRWKTILIYPGESDPITQVLKSMETFQTAVNQSMPVWGGLTLLFAGLKDGGGAMSQKSADIL